MRKVFFVLVFFAACGVSTSFATTNTTSVKSETKIVLQEENPATVKDKDKKSEKSSCCAKQAKECPKAEKKCCATSKKECPKARKECKK